MRHQVVFALSLATALWLPQSAPGFDSGPHASATIDALSWAGFNRPAADAVQVSNWLTDYYTSSPTRPEGSQCDLEKLHFDDVFTVDAISKYWATLAANTKTAVQQAEHNNDAVEFYTALGMSLHVVQDFYSHSNWVELNGTDGPYKTRTWFQTQPPPAELKTGWYDNCLSIPEGAHEPHGGYESGMNHDSVVRPHFDRAYIYALAASYEWTENVLSWISKDDFRNKVRDYTPPDVAKLADDQQASIYISEWIINPINTAKLDGHWNGNRSGYAPAFGAFTTKWVSSANSVYVNTFKTKKIYATLSKNLYTETVSEMPEFKVYPTTGTVFGMRTLKVHANSAITETDSYYGTLVATNVGNSDYAYRDASQFHRPRTDVPWQQLILVPAHQKSIDLQYTLRNEWADWRKDDPVPIQGKKKTLNFTCHLANAACTGDISGGPWSKENPYTTKPDNGPFDVSGVAVTLYFWTLPAAP